jgi:hypothetical protein
MKRLKSGKVTGPDDIPVELLPAGGDKVLDLLEPIIRQGGNPDDAQRYRPSTARPPSQPLSLKLILSCRSHRYAASVYVHPIIKCVNKRILDLERHMTDFEFNPINNIPQYGL